MTPRARSLWFFAGSLVAAAVFIRLGIWQATRLGERRAVNRVALAARELPLIILDDPTQAAGLPDSGFNNRRVEVTGRFDHAADVVIRGQSLEGVPGVRIVTPLRPLRGDTGILVQRGFVNSPDAERVDLSGLLEEGVHVVRGIAFVQPDTGAPGDPFELDGQLTWRRVDLRALRERLPYPLHSWVLLQTPDTSLPKWPRRDQAPPLDDGPHLSYMIQWFAFAVIAVVVGSVVGFRRSP
jgi:surfeit locus 1 family protein